MASIRSFSIISILPRIVLPQPVKQYVPQVGQGFPKLHRIDQRLAVSVFLIQPLQVVALNHKRRHSPAVVLDVDPGKVAAVTQKEGAPKYISRLHALSRQLNHLLSVL
jgi:hypothetical protein